MLSYLSKARALTVAGTVAFTLSAGMLAGCGGSPPTTTTTTRTTTTETPAPMPTQQTTTVERQSTVSQ